MGSIDLVVPCYRYGQYLEQCIDSILTQPVASLRVLVIDDASPDDSARTARRLAATDGRIEVRVHERNRGATATFNEGLEWASADYVLVISADDFLLPGALPRAIGLLDDNPQAAFAFGRGMRMRAGSLIADDWLARLLARIVGPGESRVLTGREFMELSGAVNIVHSFTAVVRTTMQKRVGAYRHELTHTHDMEMWLRLAAHGPVGVIKAFQGVYRMHGDNMSSAYYSNGGTADVQHRRAAFDSFFEHCGGLLDDAASLRERLMRELAIDALAKARAAFNLGREDSARELAGLALDLHPSIRHSAEWAKLLVQRAVGRSVWQTGTGIARKVLGARPDRT